MSKELAPGELWEAIESLARYVASGHGSLRHTTLLTQELSAKVLHSAAILDWTSEIPFVFLCPNHHALWHEMDRIGSSRLHEVVPEFEEHELDKLIELSEYRDKVREEIFTELRREQKSRGTRDRESHRRWEGRWATDRSRARRAERREDAGQGLRGRLPPPRAKLLGARISDAFRPLVGLRVGHKTAEPLRRPLLALLTSLAGLLAVASPVLGVLRTFGVPGIVMGDSGGWQAPTLWGFPAALALGAAFTVLAWGGCKLLRVYLCLNLADYRKLSPFRAVPRQGA